ncbi:hypothetical protein INR49_029977 [Caranx melampygus]|nr:hypothetical protein INR49_029977 [Caranx melampygus]
MMPGQTATRLPETSNIGREELDSKLQSAESRCKVLEKQLDYMRKMVENAKMERNAFMENQAALKNEQPSSTNTQTQREKLEKLESECLKLSRTQTAAEKTSEKSKLESTSSPKRMKMPFVAGTSISPSHSVHANVQCILHMMKHHQPQLCERVSALHRPGCGAKKSLQKDFSPSSPTFKKPDRLPKKVEQSLSSLSDLLLALQDELGQMSFEHQELVQQIDDTTHQKQKQDLQRDLERLVARMEEKGVQITKLRKHQQTVHKLTQSQLCAEEHTAKKLSGTKPPVPSLVKAKQKGMKGGAAHNNLQLLRETQKLRTSLKEDDLFWET